MASPRACCGPTLYFPRSTLQVTLVPRGERMITAVDVYPPGRPVMLVTQQSRKKYRQQPKVEKSPKGRMARFPSTQLPAGRVLKSLAAGALRPRGS